MALYQNPVSRTSEKLKISTQKNRQGFSLIFSDFSDLLETLDSDRGPWDLDMSAKMEALDPSRAEILRSHVAFIA